MPFLAEETSIYPEQLFEHPPDEVPERCWWLVYTKARQEKGVARHLVESSIPFFLPLIHRRHMHRGRERDSFVPLFTGYVFMYGNSDERYDSFKSNRIVTSVQVDDGPRLQRELAQVFRLICSGVPLSVESRLAPGDRVRVKHGSFVGMEGTVLRRQKGCRLQVAIQFIQQGVSVEIDDFLLEPLG